ncbi:unnamed protein product [Rotaria sp. Silwood2]|nr:unnamed protein product [Rotaria sp. Silwood2]CAF3271485.1 unnamed protein product [Rotaria sp. Silwood2]CAF3931543.1 unnamed protein product [Rotaria sp. Silwood2]CAF4697409.1 unnamed protein product [Rotaria sp. Silwood2]
MSNRNKTNKKKKSTIECGFGEKCSRRNCTFKHPDTWNFEANLRKFEQEQRENLVRLEQQQMEMIMKVCYRGDWCRRLDCPFRHSPQWNPAKNQRLAEEKLHQDEKRREQERKHALNISNEEMIVNKSGPHCHQEVKNSVPKISIDEDYQYDDDYFDLYEKVWKKQAASQVDKW